MSVAPGGRRFLLTIGVSAYADPGIPDLPGVPEDVRRLRELLLPMGYETALDPLAADPTAAAIQEAVEDWAHDTDPGPEDIVVVYFAGHGAKAADRHYLLGSTARPGRYSAALAAEDLARPLLLGEAGHVLVVLDTCFAGAGASEIAALATELAHTRRGPAGRWMLATARGKERARENVFVDALATVLNHPRAGAHQEFLGVREVTERVNRHLAERRVPQRVSHSTVDSDGHDPFFRNRAHIAGLPADALDVETLDRLRRATHGHFEARGRGVEHTGEPGDHFTGRTRALTALTSWLTADAHDRRARVVTGDPGSGKSALLGRLLRAEEHGALVPLHARRAALEDLSADLAAALRLPGTGRDEVLGALGRRTVPVTVLVDALDEAGPAGHADEGLRIARELLRPLSSLPAVRLVVGTRRPLLAALGPAVEVIDLDAPAFTTPEDVATYAAKLLLAEGDPDTRSPYRDRPDEAATVARGIAARAGHSFLVARMTARALVDGQLAADTSGPGWERELPDEAGQAFAAYLARFGPDRPRVERLLRPLAYAQGAGLPWSTLWAPLAEALSGLPCAQDDLRWLHAHAGAYLVETATPAGSAYRLFHETMAEWLRAEAGPGADAHRALAAALLAGVPDDPLTGLRDWPAAHPYVREHLATHAAAGGSLDGLLADPEYLVHAHPPELLRALASVRTPRGRLWRSVYRASSDVHRLLDEPGRRDVLAVDAARFGEREAAGELARTRTWRPRWATGSEVHTALVGSFHTQATLEATSCVEIDGQWHAVGVTTPGELHLWNLGTGAHRTVPSEGAASLAAFCELDGRARAVAADRSGGLVLWDLTTLTARRFPDVPGLSGREVLCVEHEGRAHLVGVRDPGELVVVDLASGAHTLVRYPREPEDVDVQVRAWTVLDGRPHVVLVPIRSGVITLVDLVTGRRRPPLRAGAAVFAVTCPTLDGRPHLVSRDAGNTLTVWDLDEGSRRSLTVPAYDQIFGLTTTDLRGRPHLVAACDDQTVRVWDLADGTEHLRLTGHAGLAEQVSCHTVDGRPHAVSLTDTNLRVWDLDDRPRHGTAPAGHRYTVYGAAVTELDGASCAVTAGYEGSVRLWDLREGTPRGVLTGTHTAFTALAPVPGSPARMVTASADGGVTLWDLAGRGEVTAGGRSDEDGLLSGLVAFRTGDGLHAVVGADRVIRWDLDRAGKRVLSAHGPDVAHRALALTSLGGRQVLVAGERDGSLTLSDARTERRLGRLTGHHARVTAVDCAELGGRPVAVVGDAAGAVRVWDLTTRTEVLRLGHGPHVSLVRCAALDGRPHALVATWQRTVRIHDLTTGHLVETISLPVPAEALAVHDDELLVGMSGDVLVLTREPAPPPRPPWAPRTPPA
ncbi:caspase family protein [Streptomyces sp. NPDC093111]|uniref:caspase family protein n=1 Tax=Streptomyces sp. NPDC093111 TaxID=3154978 RepID=UPI0034156FCC